MAMDPWYKIATPRKVELLQSAAQTTLESIMVDPGDQLRLQIMSSATGSDFCR